MGDPFINVPRERTGKSLPSFSSALKILLTNNKPNETMRKLFTVATLAILTGCATAPSQGYRPANYSGAPWNISGEMNQFTNSVAIKINNQLVINKTLSLFAGDGEFSGSYEGKPVTASCLTSMGLFANKVNCFVFISGEKAATLTF